MSRICPCGKLIPRVVFVAGKQRNLQRRKFCLDCSPFGSHNTRDLTRSPEDLIGVAKYRRWQEKARRERKEQLLTLLGGKCSACGYDRCLAALEFHHSDATTKAFGLSKNNLLRNWDQVLAEAQKCVILCANCHRELEEKLRLESESDA